MKTAPRDPIQIAIIVALQEEFLALFGNSELVQDRLIPQRLGRWYELQIANNVKASVTFLGAMGPAKAIEFTTKFLEHIQPLILVNIGISGTLNSDVLLGDVVVASLTDLYEDASAIEEVNGIPVLKTSGRAVETEDFKEDVDHFPFSQRAAWLAWKENCVRNRESALGRAASQIPTALIGPEVKVHTGHLACAGGVVKSLNWKHTLLRRDRKYLAVDMESAGVAIPTREARQKGMKILIVRGISDPADERKELLDLIGELKPGVVRRIALHNAGEFLKCFLPTILPATAIEATPPKKRQRPVEKNACIRSASDSVNPYLRRVLGRWTANFAYCDGKLYTEVVDIEQEGQDSIVGKIAPSLDNCDHTASVDHLSPVRLKGSFHGTPLLTGIWYHPCRMELHGAFQLRVLSESDALDGGWLMFSDTKNTTLHGAWNWKRRGLRLDPIIGVYGITGAGKTSLCEKIVSRVSGSRYFSESAAIEEYMRRFENGDLEKFKEKSETERMKAREAAFVFHRERAKNAVGLLLGDAHFSFPSIRLGKVEVSHPEEEHGVQPVMPQAAWSLYDGILYLTSPPSLIKDRLQKGNMHSRRNAWATALTTQEIHHWIEFERRKLAVECTKRGKHFFEISDEGTSEELAARAIEIIKDLQTKSY